jgi:hypothetical protein
VIRTKSPSAIGTCAPGAIFTPLTNVPHRLRRSTMRHAPASKRNRACCRDTASASGGSGRSHCSDRPSVTPAPRAGTRSGSMVGPASGTSHADGAGLNSVGMPSSIPRAIGPFIPAAAVSHFCFDPGGPRF